MKPFEMTTDGTKKFFFRRRRKKKVGAKNRSFELSAIFKSRSRTNGKSQSNAISVEGKMSFLASELPQISVREE